MAARRMRSLDRVSVFSVTGQLLYRIGRSEADSLVHTGHAKAGMGRNVVLTALQTQSPLSPVNLTSADMDGVVMGRRRSLLRLKHWPTEHDRRNVTIIAGRGVWIPDAEASEMRAKLCEQSHRASRYADAARN